MTYVVTEPCIGTKDRSCVEVCPVDCFINNRDSTLNDKVAKAAPRDGDVGMLVIHPDECIHCGACEHECPVDAIYEDDDVPEKYKDYIELNAKVTSEMPEADLEKNRVTQKE